MPKLTYARDGAEYAVEINTLSPEALAYLLQYGWAQSLQDSIAGRAKAVREEYAKNQPEAEEDEVLAAIKADVAGTLAKRMDAILSGTIGQSQGKAPTLLPGRSKEFRAVTREWLAAWAKSKGKKLPKADTPEYAALVTKFAEAKSADIQAEAERRMAGADVELDF
jgi:hypothetical protein